MGGIVAQLALDGGTNRPIAHLPQTGSIQATSNCKRDRRYLRPTKPHQGFLESFDAEVNLHIRDDGEGFHMLQGLPAPDALWMRESALIPTRVDRDSRE